jgi:hypothetical protein
MCCAVLLCCCCRVLPNPDQVSWPAEPFKTRFLVSSSSSSGSGSGSAS